MTDIAINHRSVCRACTDPFLGEEVNLMETQCILQLFETLSTTQVDPHDNVSKSICRSCNRRLEEYNQFQQMCIESFKILLRLSEDALKIETDSPSIKDEKSDQCIEEFYEDEVVGCDNICDNDDDDHIDENAPKDVEFDPLNDCDVKLDIPELALEPRAAIELEKESLSVESDDEILADKIRKSKRKNQTTKEVVKRKRKKLLRIDDNENDSRDFDGDSRSSEVNDSCAKSKRKARKSRHKSTVARRRTNVEKDTETTDEGDSGQKRKRDKPFACDKCPKTFLKKEVYEGHMRQHEGLKPFACDKCNKKYSRLERLKNHTLNDHSEEPMRFVCNVDGCDKKYRNRETLKRHINSHFNPPKPPIDKSERQVFICELCGKQLSTKGVLKEHEMMHKGEFPYACDVCPRRFRVPNKLYLHKLRHQGIKNFECKICGLKKTTNKELKSHMNVHTREKQYPCRFCDIIFLTNGNLVRHVQVVHDGIKLYACSFCDKAFGKAETLRNHTMKHTGERPLPCPHCDRRFISRTSLLYHVRRHMIDALKMENNDEKDPEKETTVTSEAAPSS